MINFRKISSFLAGGVAYAVLASAPLESRAENAQMIQQRLALEHPTVLLARALWGEASSCSKEEQIAIGYTAVNRQRKTKRPLSEILLEGYTCFKGVSGAQVLYPERHDDPKVFEQCLKVAQGILRGAYQDPTNGATHYYRSDSTPYWASSLKTKKVLQTSRGKSKHVFGKMK